MRLCECECDCVCVCVSVRVCVCVVCMCVCDVCVRECVCVGVWVWLWRECDVCVLVYVRVKCMIVCACFGVSSVIDLLCTQKMSQSVCDCGISVCVRPDCVCFLCCCHSVRSVSCNNHKLWKVWDLRGRSVEIVRVNPCVFKSCLLWLFYKSLSQEDMKHIQHNFSVVSVNKHKNTFMDKMSAPESRHSLLWIFCY